LLAALDAGSLVQFEKSKGKVLLGALLSADEKTKKNWLVVDAAGNSQSVPPKAIKLVVPGASARAAADVAEHEAAAADALQSEADTLDDVWELALEDAAAELELPTLADLFFGSAASTDCYAALALVESARGRCLFKQVQIKSSGDAGFVPRPREEAGALRSQLEKQAAAAEQAGALRSRIDDCVARRKGAAGGEGGAGGAGAGAGGADAAFDVEAEEAEAREDFAALGRLGCKGEYDEAEPADARAARFLQSLDRKGTPLGARYTP